MNPVLIIMAHGDSVETFDRHWATWVSIGVPIYVLHPTDAPIPYERQFAGATYVLSGQSQHAGPTAIARFKTAFSWMATLPFENFLVLEYDGLCLCPASELDDPGDSFIGNEFIEPTINQPPHYWMASTFLHCPWFFSKRTLQNLNYQMQRMPNGAEKGCFDRYVALACQNANIQTEAWGKRGFSANSVQPYMIPAMQDAIRNGSRMIHGAKTDEVFNAVREAMPK